MVLIAGITNSVKIDNRNLELYWLFTARNKKLYMTLMVVFLTLLLLLLVTQSSAGLLKIV